MKNKTKTYGLLVLVLGIWGVIGYKIVSVTNPSSPETLMPDIALSFNPKNPIEKDTFSIKTIDRDPFLGTLLVKKKPKEKKINKPITPEVNWMPIIYHGNIAKQDDKTKVYIVSIDGQQHLMKQGQIINDIKLVRGTSKAIIVSYKGVRKTITKT